MVNQRETAFECRYFKSDRPCTFHKQEGATCVCEHYNKKSPTILIIKLDAIGDVLRTTTILSGLAEKYDAPYITWLTRPAAAALLENNPYIDEVAVYGVDALLSLQTLSYDVCINLDAGETSCQLAALAKANNKVGFILSADGQIITSNEAARYWFELGVDDELKRCNKLTYQQIISDIVKIDSGSPDYVLKLHAEERKWARTYLNQCGFKDDKITVAINPGSGGRWPQKQWVEKRFVSLCERLKQQYGEKLQVILLGGPSEENILSRMKQEATCPVIHSGCNNSLRHFSAIIGECDVVIVGDTLAMHIALALKRRVVILFGPTSAPEIELYGLGEKVLPEMPCFCCYNSNCSVHPNCMENISVYQVFEAVVNQIQAIQPSC